MNQRTLGNLVQHWGSKITSDLFPKVLDVEKGTFCSFMQHEQPFEPDFLAQFKSCAFFAIICNRFHKCVGKMSVFFSPFPIILLPNSQCRWGIGGSRRSPEPGRRFTSGSLGFFHPGAPTATLTCEEKVSLLLEGDHTRKKCRFSSKRGRVQVLIQRLFGFFGCIFCLFVCFFGHAKLRFLDCTNPHVSKEAAHVAFQLLGKLKRNAAPHFCNTFSGGDRARLSAL